MKKRFTHWRMPKLAHNKMTKWHWVVYHPENLRLGKETDIGAFSAIFAHKKVVIENEVQIGSHCSIYTISTIDGKEGSVVFRKNCKIGSHCTIMPGVEIGENTIVGAHSFVNRSLPANVVAVGCPVRIIRTLRIQT